jgi:hypothetical protein
MFSIPLKKYYVLPLVILTFFLGVFAGNNYEPSDRAEVEVDGGIWNCIFKKHEKDIPLWGKYSKGRLQIVDRRTDAQLMYVRLHSRDLTDEEIGFGVFVPVDADPAAQRP